MIVLSLLLILFVNSGLVIGAPIVTRLAPAAWIDSSADRAIISTWLGVLVLANTFFAASLFSPLTPAIVITITLALLIPALLSQRNRDWIKEFAGKLSAGPL